MRSRSLMAIHSSSRTNAAMHPSQGLSDFSSGIRGTFLALRSWCGLDPEAGHYALALDCGKQQVRTLTSNVGHLLWSGIVEKPRAAAIARDLMSEALYSGWGVRTLSNQEQAYNPIGCHRGTVWPHDNSVAADGSEVPSAALLARKPTEIRPYRARAKSTLVPTMTTTMAPSVSQSACLVAQRCQLRGRAAESNFPWAP